MSEKASFPCAFLVTLLALGVAQCQTPTPPLGSAVPPGVPMPAGVPVQTGIPAPARSAGMPSPSPAALGSAADPTSNLMQPSGPTEDQTPIAPSAWITYPQPGCCGPVGGNGPILMDLYMRQGVSIPVGGDRLERALAAGWMFQFGGRSYFFNSERDAAWIVDLGIGNIHQGGSSDNFPILVLGQAMNVRAMNRTYGSIGLGREYYFQPATCGRCGTKGDSCAGGNCGGCSSCGGGDGPWWTCLRTRWGWDGGGRYGTCRIDLLDFNQASAYARINDVDGGVYLALHSDVELPIGCCTYFLGGRAEWDYFWQDIAPQNNTDVQSINFLINVGVRY